MLLIDVCTRVKRKFKSESVFETSISGFIYNKLFISTVIYFWFSIHSATLCCEKEKLES